MSQTPLRGAWAALPFLLLVALVHLVLAWPGAGERGVIAEEVQPYLHHYPKVLEQRGNAVAYLPSNDDPTVVDAIEHGRELSPRWVGTLQWPEVGYQGRRRVWPAFVRGHQTALGTLWGIALAPLLGDGIAGIRRSSVLMGLGLLVLVWGLARRFGVSRGWATVATIGCAASPGLWWFCRTGYGYELASRVFMIAALWLAAPLGPLSRRRAIAAGLAFAAALLCRATIATTLAPALLLMLFHPRRWAGPVRSGIVVALGGGLPIALVGLALATLPFAAGTAPAAGIQIEGLANRTLTAPAAAWVQLAWVVDPRVILARIVEGDLHVEVGWIRPALGASVLCAALVRWWQARAGEAERIFVAGLLGNALVGAWLYGDPMQFQLGMALEPLFVLALTQQIAEVFPLSRGTWCAAVLLGLRGLTLGSLWSSEQRTDNPMLSARAQHGLVALLDEDEIRGDDLITTAYDHVGVLEVWTGERLRPIHAWRPLRAAGRPESEVVAQWDRILDAHPACHVLLTVAPSLVAGPFSDHRAVAAALERALSGRGGHVDRRRTIQGNGGAAVFELVDVSPCTDERRAR